MFKDLPMGEIYLAQADGSSFYQTLPIHQDYQKYFAFGDHRSVWISQRLQYGFCDAPAVATFHVQALVQEIAAELQSRGIKANLVAYMDDILFAGASREAVLAVWRILLEKTIAKGFTLARSKCKIAVKSIEALGHILTSQGLSPAPSSIRNLENLEAPTSKHQLCSLLGYVNWLHQFIPGLSERAKPIIALHSKEKLSLKDWNQECQDALEDLQDSPIPLPLSPFVFGLKTYLTTDASPTALAYAITQQGLDGTERIVEFRSRTLTKSEQNYTQIKREALALTWALVTAQHYLQYHPFTWTTDCKPLIGVLQNAADKPGSIWARWWDHIRSFPMEVSWMKGDLNPMHYPTRCFNSRVDSDLYNQALKILDGDPSTNSIPKKRFRMIKKFVTRDENGLRWKKTKSLQSSDERLQIIIEKHAEHHHGPYSIYSQLSRDYYWPQMFEDIKEFAGTCFNCVQASNYNAPGGQRTLRRHGFGNHYAVVWCQSAQGCCLVVVDTFTNFVFLFPHPTPSSKFAAGIILWLSQTYGPPARVTADNAFGEEFDIITKLGIKRSRSSPYSPTGNSLAERYVQATIKAARKLLLAREDLTDAGA